MERITKPLICEECPVCSIEKKKIVCRICGLEADNNSLSQKIKMYESCKIDWDK